MPDSIPALPKIKNLHQSYLFIHQKEETRTTLAINLAQEIFSSQEILSHPDFFIFHPQTAKYGINLIRELKVKIALKPYQGKYKVVLIEEAQELTVEAQNAFLKTLEEPNQSTIIILTSDHQEKLLPTITSRCETFNFNTAVSTSSCLSTEEYLVLNQLLGKSISERFQYIEKAFPEKDVALLKKWYVYNRKLLWKKVENITSEKEEIKKILHNLKTLQQIINLVLETNTNFRLALEILLLKLEKVQI